jgi:hypothetical protein
LLNEGKDGDDSDVDDDDLFGSKPKKTQVTATLEKKESAEESNGLGFKDELAGVLAKQGI